MKEDSQMDVVIVATRNRCGSGSFRNCGTLVTYAIYSAGISPLSRRWRMARGNNGPVCRWRFRRYCQNVGTLPQARTNGHEE